jgi:UDP:flavonoid glycosyltransferase YjiC (YdhE family)
MKFALAIHGSRGDVEPFAAVGLELQNRGHEVRMAFPPNMIGFVQSAGLDAVEYGPSSEAVNEEDFIRNVWSISTPAKVLRASQYYLGEVWAEMGTTLASLADGTDLLMTGMIQQGIAVNVAEYQRIPLVGLHCFPVRINSQVLPALPKPLVRTGISAFWWAHWIMTMRAETNQRRKLGLPGLAGPSTRRITDRRSLEIQAYDELFFPGLASEWAQWSDQRPFVGALTMNMPTDADNEISSWCAAGAPPIYFGFGSMPVRSFGTTVEMISAACAELGERALIYLGANDMDRLWSSDRVKIAGPMNHAAILPNWRAGIPTLILWVTADQPIWAAQVKRLGVGSARRFSGTTQASLVAELRGILTASYVTRAREIAGQLTGPDESVAATANLLEKAAGERQFR